MKTLKKLFSVSAIVALLGTLAPMYAFGAGNSLDLDPEFPQAYAYAYANGITTQSEDNADMGGKLTRIALAKMIAKYAINVLELTPDTSKTCTFTDVTAALDAQYDNGVTQACQLGLMGVNITAFRPNDLVTRGEFGTTFSRALNADSDELAAMNAADPYYKEHLNYLNKEGIMKVIDPNMLEVRGYVMLMMMRADDSYEPSAAEGCSAEELLACFNADDYDACIAACSDEGEEEEQDPEEVKAGTLNVTMTSEKGGEVVNKVSALPIVTYTLKATDEDIDVNSLVLKEVGYGEGITMVALFINGQRVSKPKPVNALDKEITVNLNSAYTVKAGKSVDIEVRATVDNTSVDAFAVELTNVNSSAEKVKLPSNAKSNTFKLLSTPTTEITVATAASEKVKVGSKNAEIFEFTVRNTSATPAKKQDVELNAITFVANNKDMVDYFQNFELVVDGEVVATTSKMDGKYLTFKLNSSYTVEKAATANFTVKADVIGGADVVSALTFDVEYAMDVDATCPTYEAPVSVVKPAAAVPVVIEAGRITITRVNPTSTTFAKNTNNVYLGNFTVTNNEKSDLTLEKFTLVLTDQDSDDTVELADYILADNVKVKYGKNAGYSSLDCDYNGTTTVLTCESDTDVTIGSSTTVYVYADIENDDDTDWLKDESFKMTLDVTNSDPVVATDPLLIKENKTDSYVSDISAQTTWSLMEGTTSTLSVTRVSLTDKTYSYGTEGVDAVSFKIKTNENGVRVKSLTFDSFAVAAPIDYEITTADRNMIAAARVFVGDDEYSATLNANGEITMKNAFELGANTTTTITLQIDLGNGGTTPTSKTFAYGLKSIVANDTTSDKNPLDYNPSELLAGRNITTNNGGTLTLSYENTAINDADKSILAGTTGDVAEYSIKANYEKVNVKEIDVVFNTKLTSTNVDDVELYLDGDLVASDPTWSSDGKTATFKDLTMSADTTKAALVVRVVTKPYTANTVTALTNVYVDELNITKASGKESGNDIDKSCTDNSKLFDVVPATVTATLTSTSNTETKLNLAVNKGENVDASDDAVKVYIVDTVAQLVSDNGAMKSYTVSLNNKLIGTYTIGETPARTLATSNTADFELREGNNEVIINYTLNSITGDPSYNVDLLRIEYVTNTTHTIPATMTLTELGTLKETAFSNRMARLDLVTR